MEVVEAVIACPVRLGAEGVLETLLTKRPCWNERKERPMRFPGEWAFPGGKLTRSEKRAIRSLPPRELEALMRSGSSPWYGALVRELGEELGCEGSWHVLGCLGAHTNGGGSSYRVVGYVLAFHQGVVLKPSAEEIAALQWWPPGEALRYLTSPAFEQEQELLFRRVKAEHSRFTIEEREKPLATYAFLERLARRQKEYRGVLEQRPLPQGVGEHRPRELVA